MSRRLFLLEPISKIPLGRLSNGTTSSAASPAPRISPNKLLLKSIPAMLCVSVCTGCVDRVRTEGAPCPCANGLVCCETRNVCLSDTDPCEITPDDNVDAAIHSELDGESTGAEDSSGRPNPSNGTCGNSVVERNEQCDDGNHQRLDGCNSDCTYEFAHRVTSVYVLKTNNVPDWCIHKANRYAEAFTEETASDINLSGIDIINNINDALSSQITERESIILHIMDSDDIGMKTADDNITIGIYLGYPFIESEYNLDSPFIIEAEQVEIAAMQVASGKVSSKEPTDLEFMGVNIGYDFKDYMIQLAFDLESSSTPNAEPVGGRDAIKVSDNLILPEVSGKNPAGIFCAAMGLPDDVPIDNASYFMDSYSRCCKNRGGNSGSPYRLCGESMPPTECDSLSSLIQEGCTICPGSSDISEESHADAHCDLMKTDPSSCFSIINGTEYDVDTDGDGKNDRWSALFGFDTERIRIYDVSTK